MHFIFLEALLFLFNDILFFKVGTQSPADLRIEPILSAIRLWYGLKAWSKVIGFLVYHSEEKEFQGTPKKTEVDQERWNKS